MAEGTHGTLDHAATDAPHTEHGGHNSEGTTVIQRAKGIIDRHFLQRPGHLAGHDSNDSHGDHGHDGAVLDVNALFGPGPTVPDTISKPPSDERIDGETGKVGEERTNGDAINRVQAIYDFIKDVPGVDDIIGPPENAIDDRGLIKFSYAAKLGNILRNNPRLREKVVDHLKRLESEGAKLSDTYLPKPKEDGDGDGDGDEPVLTEKEKEQLHNLEYTFKQIMENSDDPQAMFRAKQDLENEGVVSLMNRIKRSKRYKYYSMAGAGIFTLVFLSLLLQYGFAKAAANFGGKGGRH